jgi:hypothetical protein
MPRTNIESMFGAEKLDDASESESESGQVDVTQLPPG